MKELEDKVPVELPKKRNHTGLIIAALCALVIIGGAILALVLLPERKEAEPKESATDEIPSSDIIASFEDYSLRCTYLTGKNSLSHLWDANSFVNTHSGKDSEGDNWEIYSPDLHIPGLNFTACFCEGGEEIITALTGITSETCADAVALLECSVSSVYNYTYHDLEEFLINRDRYPLTPDESGESVLSLAGLPDGAGRKYDEGTEPCISFASCRLNGEMGEEILYYQLRTRIYEGKEVFDIFLLHTRAE